MNVWEICGFLLGVICLFGISLMGVTLLLVFVLGAYQGIRKHVFKK